MFCVWLCLLRVCVHVLWLLCWEVELSCGWELQSEHHIERPNMPRIRLHSPRAQGEDRIRSRSYYKCMTSVCISVSVCLCCTCMCCTIFLSCTRNSLASVARSDRTFSAWESCPWKDKDRSRDVRRYRKYRQRASELYLTNFTKACSTKDKNLTALSLENKQF